MTPSRRHFLATLGALPLLTALPFQARASDYHGRILVLVELAGGNDGLNMVVPFTDPVYHRLRPGIGLDREHVIPLDERLGLNSVMGSLMPAWQAGDLALALGVGYAKPNRSHFRSIEIWDTASPPDVTLDQGWIAATLEQNRPSPEMTTDGIVLSNEGAGPLAGAGRFIALRNPGRFIRDARLMPETAGKGTVNAALRHILAVQEGIDGAATGLAGKGIAKTAPGPEFPADNKLARQLELAARVIAGEASIAVIKTTLGGFDTHTGQVNAQTRLLAGVAEALSAFRDSMLAAGLWDRVLVMTYSEFGRRVNENGSGGTDHGTAAPHLLLGGRVRGGFYGSQPALDDLDGKDLRHTVDFRQLYGTVLRDWWELPAQWPGHAPLGFIRA